MHMPGHKRNFVKFPWLRELGGEFDITEIEGFDDLHDPDGLILDINRRAAALWGSRQAFLTVNGSTGGIFAAIAAAVPAGGRVLVARNCHRSVFNAASALRLQTEYVVPPVVSGFGIFGSVTPEAVDRALREKPCHAVVVTSPTYEGAMSDVRGIAEVCAMHGALLVVDGAHGAHLGLSDAFPDGGTGEDADIVVQSLHKTLPALTQTAIVRSPKSSPSLSLRRRPMSSWRARRSSWNISKKRAGNSSRRLPATLSASDGKRVNQRRCGCWAKRTGKSPRFSNSTNQSCISTH